MAKEKSPAEQRPTGAKRFYSLVVMLIVILLLVAGSIALWIMTPWPVSEETAAQTDSVFGVKTITLQGNTKYSEEAVIGESGVVVGESIFSVSSNAVQKQLLATFPYFTSVEVQTLHMDEVQITVTEASVIGAIYADGYWVLVGSNGKALEQKDITTDTPKGLLYIKGTDAPEGGVKLGGAAMDEYCTTILQTLLSAINQYEFADVNVIDMTDKNDLRLTWNDQIVVKLGNATNLTHEVGVVASVLPSVLQKRGQNVTGVLDVSSYSNDTLENQAVFTPSSLLTTTTTATRRAASGEAVTTTTTEPDDA